jgi:diketogulonate reductase-like aldo/keto reductase
MDPRRRAALGTLAAIAAAPALTPFMASRSHARAPLASRAIPSTGEALPIVGLGTWQTFDVGDDAAARAPLGEVLTLLTEAGGRAVDSSPMYGSAEAVLGELAAALGLRERLFMATKVWTRGRGEGLRQIEQSLRRLRVEQLDLLQVHNLVDTATHTETFRELKGGGRLRYSGITHSRASAHAEIERWLNTRQYDFVQINYSLAERDAGARVLPLASDLGVAVMVNRPFAEGALFRRVRGKPLPAWAVELGIGSWAQYFLKWIFGHPAVTCAIPGTSRPAHMRDNLAAARGPLPDERQRLRMAQYFDSL